MTNLRASTADALPIIEGAPGVGSVVTYRAGASVVRHLSANCRHLARARHVQRTRETELWPGFVCDTCRIEATCATCRRVWPYCECKAVDGAS